MRSVQGKKTGCKRIGDKIDSIRTLSGNYLLPSTYHKKLKTKTGFIQNKNNNGMFFFEYPVVLNETKI